MKQREKTDKIFQDRMQKKQMNYAGCTWSFMEMIPCFSSYAISCTASMKNEAAH